MGSDDRTLEYKLHIIDSVLHAKVAFDYTFSNDAELSPVCLGSIIYFQVFKPFRVLASELLRAFHRC